MKNRNLAIDFWKFVCALYLVFYHFAQLTGVNAFGIDYMNNFNLVEWFFIISGFMITTSDKNYFAKENVDKSTGHRLLYRLKRIYPMFAISVITAATIMYAYRLIFGEWWWNGQIHGIKNLVLSLFALTYSGIFQSDYILGINSPTWFIDALIFSYAIYYFIIFLSRKLNFSRVYAYVAFMLLGFYAYYNDIMLPFFNRELGRGYAAFFFGCVLYYVLEYVSDRKLKIGFFAAVSYLLFWKILLGAEMLDDIYFIRGYIWGCAILILFVKFDIFNKIFSMIPGVDILGGASYEVFLWHVPVLNIFYMIWKFIGKEDITSTDAIIFAVICEIVATFMYIFVEKKLYSKSSAC